MYNTTSTIRRMEEKKTIIHKVRRGEKATDESFVAHIFFANKTPKEEMHYLTSEFCLLLPDPGDDYHYIFKWEEKETVYHSDLEE